MSIQFTSMAQEAISDAVQSAAAAGNPQIETLHLADALLRQENGTGRALVKDAGGDPQAVGADVRRPPLAALQHSLNPAASCRRRSSRRRKKCSASVTRMCPAKR